MPKTAIEVETNKVDFFRVFRSWECHVVKSDLWETSRHWHTNLCCSGHKCRHSVIVGNKRLVCLWQKSQPMIFLGDWPHKWSVTRKISEFPDWTLTIHPDVRFESHTPDSLKGKNFYRYSGPVRKVIGVGHMVVRLSCVCCCFCDCFNGWTFGYR